MRPEEYDRFFLNKNIKKRGKLIAEGILSIVIQFANGECEVWPISDCVEIV